ncbi:MAG: hypothetical protein COT90_00225 [Candidatus Diapherotrites archaeon CG10_big_fil_rev_8_21_14_0_10_31_34]|nr:MAG: hypothetical protein COT90_00225 [Candidatus Diapherotrites archaeon CG10_big_fil_rev_8_21_14_0_10_31_34]PJA16270.1 MAG: hypothetical protein COX63_03425 [Candidatus Diapherotrites archaeon CG_4_10_14_0_2_um_filter_31_5]
MTELTDELTIGKEEFKALSSDTRIEIIKLLNERNYTLSELSSKLKMSSPTIKQHLELLVNSDLIKQQDEGRKWKYYSLTRKGKKLSEPESHNIMILLSATIIGCLFLVYIIFGTNLVMNSGMSAPEKTSFNDNQYAELISGAQKEEDKRTTESIQEILGKSKELTNIEFDLVEQTNGDTTTSKYYLKNGKYRTETGTQENKVVQIFDGDNLFYYGSYSKEGETSLGVIVDAIPSVTEDPAGIQKTTEQALNDPELKEIGKEVINGLNTRIIEYTFNEQKVKAWISEEYGITVKTEKEIQINGNSVLQTKELKNIKIGLVADSLFKTD